MVEQRVIGQKIGARPSAPSTPPPPEPVAEEAPAKEKKKRGGRRRALLLAIAAVVLVAAGAAAYLLLIRPGAAAADTPPPEPAPVPGEVLTIDPVSVNLADGHYLRLGLALQLTADVAEAPDPAHALDLAIAWYSGRSIAEVTDPATREQLKSQLRDQLAQAYDGEVMDLYLTDYVTQ